MLIDGEKWACEACVRGHRVSNCQHSDRPLQHINKKGRPVSQCPNCRGLRKSRSSHVKCECGDKPHNKEHCRDGDRRADQPCSCNREKRCSCAIKRELLGPLTEAPKRGIKRTRSSTETDKDKARPRGLSATQSDPNLQVFAKRHKAGGYHRYSHSGQESSTYHRPHSQQGAAAYSPISVDNMMAQNGAFMMGRRPHGLQGFSPYSTESMDSLAGLPYDVHRPMMHGIPGYSSESMDTYSTLPRDGLQYEIPRPRSIHGHAPYAHKLDGFPQMRDSTPQLYADGVAMEERRARSAHTSPGPAPHGKLANQYPHLEIPSFGGHNPGNITSSPIGDEYGHHQRYGNLDYVSPTEGPGSVGGDPPSMPVTDWTPMDLPLNNPGAFTSGAHSHASSYTSFDPGLLAQQPGLTDASSGEVSEADEYAPPHAGAVSPSAAGTSPFVQAAVAPYGVSAPGDPYGDLAQTAAGLMGGPHSVDGLSVEPYLHRATASPVDQHHHNEYALPVKAESDNYPPPPPHHMSVPPDLGGHGVAQPTSDPSWVVDAAGPHDAAGAGAYALAATTAQPTSDPSWAHADDGTGPLSPHHSQPPQQQQPTSDPSWAAAQYAVAEAEAMSPHMAAQARMHPGAAAHDGVSPEPAPASRHQSPYAAALQPTSDPTWAASAAIAAAHDPVGVAPPPAPAPPPRSSPSPANAAGRSRNHSPHPSVAPTSDPTWIAAHAFGSAAEMPPGLDMASVAALQQQQQQQRQGTPPGSAHGDAAQKLGQQQVQRGWSPAAAAAFAEQQHQQQQQAQAQFHAGSTTPQRAGAYAYDP